jgi:hypothetical protein
VLERQGDAIRFHPTLLAFAAHYRFEPRPVAVARCNEKGRASQCTSWVGWDDIYAVTACLFLLEHVFVVWIDAEPSVACLVPLEHGLARPENLETLDRSDPALIVVAEELGQNAGAPGTELIIIELPDDAKWRVRTVCGFEFLQLSDALIPAR